MRVPGMVGAGVTLLMWRLAAGGSTVLEWQPHGQWKGCRCGVPHQGDGANTQGVVEQCCG
jgi:hypothetical protein